MTDDSRATDESVQFAFRCRNCGHLESAAAAGERLTPIKCRSCGKGAHFILTEAGTPEQIIEPDSWDVLADLPDAERAALHDFHALTDANIVRHDPGNALANPAAPVHHARDVAEGIGAEDVAS